MDKKLVLLGMGGTIAGTAKVAGDNVGYTAGQVPVAQLLEAVPTVSGLLKRGAIVAEQVCQIDSKDLVDGDWFALTARVVHHLAQDDVQSIVVTHGTDTIEETAYWLTRLIPGSDLARKPVVLTCAMRPASALTPDGPANMADAVAVAMSPGARGVVVVCAGKIHSAAHVQKVHPYRVDAFDSGEAGPIGVIEEGRVRLLTEWPRTDIGNPVVNWTALQLSRLPRVELLASHAGASGAVVRSLLTPAQGDAPLRGLVVMGTGNGTVHKELEQALRMALAQGIRVARVSRCGYGAVVQATRATTAVDFPVYALSAVKARIALMLDIAAADLG